MDRVRFGILGGGFLTVRKAPVHQEQGVNQEGLGSEGCGHAGRLPPSYTSVASQTDEEGQAAYTRFEMAAAVTAGTAPATLKRKKS